MIEENTLNVLVFARMELQLTRLLDTEVIIGVYGKLNPQLDDPENDEGGERLSRGYAHAALAICTSDTN